MITVLRSDLKVLHQASAGDFTGVDLLHIYVARTEEPGDQNLQVVYELTINLYTRRMTSQCLQPVLKSSSIFMFLVYLWWQCSNQQNKRKATMM